jgi:hypothetical protein
MRHLQLHHLPTVQVDFKLALVMYLPKRGVLCAGDWVRLLAHGSSKEPGAPRKNSSCRVSPIPVGHENLEAQVRVLR